MKAVLLLVAILCIGCKCDPVVVKPPRPKPMPVKPIDRYSQLPKDADLSAMVEALVKDLIDLRKYSEELELVVDATTEPEKKQK